MKNYDGNRVIQERDGSNVPTVTYTRGTDLSGTLESAGGIGGLLARSHGYSSGNWTTHNFYHADGNGNITALVDSTQALAASYRYDPFGNLISKSGTLADANVYRFSSKEFHGNSGLYYYLYRFYWPGLQRWLNADPVRETAFQNMTSTHPRRETYRGNLYCFVDNSPLTKRDHWGLIVFDGCSQNDQEKIKKAVDANCGKAKSCALKCPSAGPNQLRLRQWGKE